MERLTYFDNGHWRLKWKGCEYSAEWVDRLAAYEDTGLAPEEIADAVTDAKLIARSKIVSCFGVDADHVRELVEAERDGRLAVLPEEE